MKRLRSFIRSRHQSHETLNSAESKDVKFVSFVKKLDEIKPSSAKPEREKSSDKSVKVLESSKHIESEKELEVDKVPNEIVKEKKIESEKEPSQTEIVFKCLHDEIILCECCRYTNTPSTSFVQAKRDIFHLTSASTDDQARPNNFIHRTKLSNISESKQSQQHVGLREILISNYDPKFASKIGIKDFIPIQVMTSQIKQDLEFIPFEQIDQSYAK